MRVRVVFLSDSPLVLFLLKHKSAGTSLNKKKKKKDPKRKPLNSSKYSRVILSLNCTSNSNVNLRS